MNAFLHPHSASRVAATLAMTSAAALLGGCGPGPLAPIGPLFGPGGEWLVGVLLLLFIAVVAVALDRWHRRRTTPRELATGQHGAPLDADLPSNSAHGPSGEIKDILLKRYARGEIDRDAFRQMWNDLSL